MAKWTRWTIWTVTWKEWKAVLLPITPKFAFSKNNKSQGTHTVDTCLSPATAHRQRGGSPCNHKPNNSLYQPSLKAQQHIYMGYFFRSFDSDLNKYGGRSHEEVAKNIDRHEACNYKDRRGDDVTIHYMGNDIDVEKTYQGHYLNKMWPDKYDRFGKPLKNSQPKDKTKSSDKKSKEKEKSKEKKEGKKKEKDCGEEKKHRKSLLGSMFSSAMDYLDKPVTISISTSPITITKEEKPADNNLTDNGEEVEVETEETLQHKLEMEMLKKDPQAFYAYKKEQAEQEKRQQKYTLIFVLASLLISVLTLVFFCSLFF